MCFFGEDESRSLFTREQTSQSVRGFRLDFGLCFFFVFFGTVTRSERRGEACRSDEMREPSFWYFWMSKISISLSITHFNKHSLSLRVAPPHPRTCAFRTFFALCDKDSQRYRTKSPPRFGPTVSHGSCRLIGQSSLMVSRWWHRHLLTQIRMIPRFDVFSCVKPVHPALVSSHCSFHPPGHQNQSNHPLWSPTSHLISLCLATSSPVSLSVAHLNQSKQPFVSTYTNPVKLSVPRNNSVAFFPQPSQPFNLTGTGMFYFCHSRVWSRRCRPHTLGRGLAARQRFELETSSRSIKPEFLEFAPHLALAATFDFRRHILTGWTRRGGCLIGPLPFFCALTVMESKHWLKSMSVRNKRKPPELTEINRGAQLKPQRYRWRHGDKVKVGGIRKGETGCVFGLYCGCANQDDDLTRHNQVQEKNHYVFGSISFSACFYKNAVQSHSADFFCFFFKGREMNGEEVQVRTANTPFASHIGLLWPLCPCTARHGCGVV